MIDWTWITVSGTAVLMVLLTALGIYVALILFTRLVGLRSFSKMSSFDFAITVSMGTVLATTLINKNPPLLQGIVALAALYGIQFAVSVLRRHSQAVAWMVDNDPLLLMAGDEVLYDNLKKAQITPEDLKAKLREANVIHLGQVRAVVMESTGDVSVLHASPDEPDLDLDLLSGVRDIERLRARPDV
ncbi:MAG: DUF421 domain-containing protein [Rhodothermales bacterium]